MICQQRNNACPETNASSCARISPNQLEMAFELQVVLFCADMAQVNLDTLWSTFVMQSSFSDSQHVILCENKR